MPSSSKYPKTRVERDHLGELVLPGDAYYGIQSYRAQKNFPISGTQVHPELIRSYLLLKKAAARANVLSGVLDPFVGEAVMGAVDELLESSDFLKHFIVDAYQAGAGTSQNMNVNEVIANVANESLGTPLGGYDPVHPHNHVNQSQSTNDTYPTVLRLTCLTLSHALIDQLKHFSQSLLRKSQEFDAVLKSGRTHLQDAVPIRLGQEFAAYGHVIKGLTQLIVSTQNQLRELGIGGSAVGTGLNVPSEFPGIILKELQKEFHDPQLVLASDRCATTQSQWPVLVYSQNLSSVATELTRIFNDLRLMSSGPHNGLGELILPAVQAGSSMMPGKVNPSMLEMGNQVCFKVMGNGVAMTLAAQAGQLELNVMMPLMAQLVLESSMILTQSLRVIREYCIDGIKAQVEQCRRYAEQTDQVVTALSPLLGYEQVALIVKEAQGSDRSVLDILREKRLLSEKQLADLLDPWKQTNPKAT